VECRGKIKAGHGGGLGQVGGTKPGKEKSV